ncbi:hypothetical protein [Amycolatopsis sp. NPDC059657]|uniref:hypothetical protein n=1 Tax=Amycolatopsis sp. NPDC059657 TaxID=3346899 RepID=UPI00366F4188
MNARVLTMAGLLIGAIGIAVLWASGVVFPFYPPPGILILSAGTIFIALVKWRWAPLVGTALGLFIIAGFLISPTGIGNLTGDYGAATSIGTVIQLAGVLTATIAGVAAAVPARRVMG